MFVFLMGDSISFQGAQCSSLIAAHSSVAQVSPLTAVTGRPGATIEIVNPDAPPARGCKAPE
jgi:hypothetical protein